MQVNIPRTRAAVAGLATLGLSASVLAVGLATAPAAQAAGLASVVINEVESNQGGANGDWIELYNTDTVAVDLTDAILSDSDNTHQILLTGSIAPGGFVTVNVDASTTPGNFGLGGADSARLFAPGANLATATPIDSFSWTNHASTTYGREADGIGGPRNNAAFYTTNASTYNASNNVTVPGAQPVPNALKGVYINEVETQGDTVNGDWIELYNSKTTAVTLTGAILSDNNNTHTVTLPTATIASGGYYTVVVENAAGVGPFALGDVDSARLFEAGTTDLSRAQAVDSYSWNAHATTSYGRDWLDLVPGQWGTDVGRWTLTESATYNTENNVGSGSGTDLTGLVVINEVESNGDTVNGDWVEIRNNSGSPVAIAGALISDSDDTHAFQIPVTTPALAAGGYAAFRVDDPAVDGSFGLGGTDSARLFNPNANFATDTPVDTYSWTAHAGNTYGRCPNGTGSFVNTLAGTFAAANSCA